MPLTLCYHLSLVRRLNVAVGPASVTAKLEYNFITTPQLQTTEILSLLHSSSPEATLPCRRHGQNATHSFKTSDSTKALEHPTTQSPIDLRTFNPCLLTAAVVGAETEACGLESEDRGFGTLGVVEELSS